MVRQLLAKIAKVDIVDELADDLNRTLATARQQLTGVERLPSHKPCRAQQVNRTSFT